MKKILIVFSILLLCACSINMGNSPKEKVKDFLDKYKNQDEKVLSDLDKSISSNYTGNYKERYKNLMIKQYKDMDYNITDEIIEENSAIVTVDIIVYDYSKTLEYVNNYVKEHKENFIKENEQKIDNDKFMDYKLTELEKVSDKKTYSINFSLIKENDEWLIEDLDKSDIEKIHGIYIE